MLGPLKSKLVLCLICTERVITNRHMWDQRGLIQVTIRTGQELSVSVHTIAVSHAMKVNVSKRTSAGWDTPDLFGDIKGVSIYTYTYIYIFFLYFLMEMRFHHVGQAGLELLTSDDLPVSASQSVGLQA